MTEHASPYRELIRLLLPDDLFDYFDVIDIEVEDRAVQVYLDEIDNKPDRYSKEKLAFPCPETGQ